jgi:DNA-binding transcriptional LysR family regulator
MFAAGSRPIGATARLAGVILSIANVSELQAIVSTIKQRGKLVKYDWLKDFLSLAETGNFTTAADKRHSSQSAFSRRIEALELWLGAKLFHRRRRYRTVLTPAGERFHAHAAELVRRMVNSRAELRGEPISGTETITFALPHTLASSRFPALWKEWRESAGNPSCRLLADNVHDSVTNFVAGLADILICFHHTQQPINLDLGHYDRVVLGTEWLRPYAAVRGGQPIFTLPGTARSPIPLLTYSAGAFVGRMVDLILQSTEEELYGTTVCESDLADALLGMAVAGHGVAWLPECTAAGAVEIGSLRAIGDKKWSLPLTLYAYRDRADATPAVNRLMSYLESRATRNASATPANSQLAGSARFAHGDK